MVKIAGVVLPEISNGRRSFGKILKDATINKWTAQGINDFQKTLFPFIFLIFTILFSICSYYKVGDIESEDLNA